MVSDKTWTMYMYIFRKKKKKTPQDSTLVVGEGAPDHPFLLPLGGKQGKDCTGSTMSNSQCLSFHRTVTIYSRKIYPWLIIWLPSYNVLHAFMDMCIITKARHFDSCWASYKPTEWDLTVTVSQWRCFTRNPALMQCALQLSHTVMLSKSGQHFPNVCRVCAAAIRQ